MRDDEECGFDVKADWKVVIGITLSMIAQTNINLCGAPVLCYHLCTLRTLSNTTISECHALTNQHTFLVTVAHAIRCGVCTTVVFRSAWRVANTFYTVSVNEAKNERKSVLCQCHID